MAAKADGVPTTVRMFATSIAIQEYVRSRGAGASKTIENPAVVTPATAAFTPSARKALSLASRRLRVSVTTKSA